MHRVIIATNTGNTCNLNADTITLHGDKLYVYSGEELVGVFLEETIKMAYKTESKAGAAAV